MNAFIQETDIRDPGSTIFTSWSSLVSEETVGTTSHSNLFPMITNSWAVGSAWGKANQLDNKNMANQAKGVLYAISDWINKLQTVDPNIVDKIPSLNAFAPDDGSFLLEWIFEDLRIGFSIETDANESSWYLVSTENLGEANASGYLKGLKVESIVLWLIMFMLYRNNG